MRTLNALLLGITLAFVSNAAFGICTSPAGPAGAIVCQNTVYTDWIVGRDADDDPGDETVLACARNSLGQWVEVGNIARSG